MNRTQKRFIWLNFSLDCNWEWFPFKRKFKSFCNGDLFFCSAIKKKLEKSIFLFYFIALFHSDRKINLREFRINRYILLHTAPWYLQWVCWYEFAEVTVPVLLPLLGEISEAMWYSACLHPFAVSEKQNQFTRTPCLTRSVLKMTDLWDSSLIVFFPER